MVTSDMLLLNHHLGDIYFCTSEENYDSDKSRILIESWESEFIVTTFVQLFHTLLSNRNSMLIKFNKLAKSIFIIDEIQGLPLKYWKLISQLLDETLRMFDSYAIIMTATKPLYFDETKGIELINFDWSQLDRYIVDAKTYAHTQDMKSFIDIFPVESDKTYLFVLNTVKEATDFYNFLKEKIPKQQEKIGFLSTHVTPEERIQRINGVKNGAIKYLVSTQIVEAGVDIDFDVVVRDMAPLDSIIQSAGRCNRSGEHYTGQVYVTRFTNAQNKDKTFGSYIYDKTLLEITENLLKDNVFHEKDLESLFKRYESDIQKKKDTEGLSDILYKNVINLNYSGENGITSFQVIDEKFPKIDIFIELNSDAADVFQRYRQIKEIRNIFERKRAFSEIKNQFYKYVISIPSTTQNIPPVDSDFLYVPIGNLTDYYDPDTGFILEGRDAIW
jgi:CRISPR-associated endonuclease/helicase Cas3